MEETKPSDRQLAVSAENVSYSHGRKKITLDKINLSVQRGQIYGLLGPSGCGKTTLLRCIVGRLRPKKGVVRTFGRIPGESGFCIPGHGVGYMPQELALYPEITTEETMVYFGRLCQMEHPQIRDRTTFLVSLIDIPDKKILIKNLSGGQQRRVSFAVALIHKPPLLILDEPTVGVDPILRQNIWKHLKDMVKEDHISVIITTHYVEEARQADMVGLMRDGKLLTQMQPESLMKKHHASSLEQVFLRLCRKEDRGEQSMPREHTILMTEKDDNPVLWTVKEESNDIDVEEKEEVFTVIDEKNPTDSLLPPDIEVEYSQPPLLTRLNYSRIRMNTLMAKSFIRLKRNIPLAFFELFVPLFQVVIFCLCIGGQPFDLPIAVVNEETDPTRFGQQFLNTLSNETFHQEHFNNLTLAKESTRKGETWGVVHIGPQFTESLIDRFIDGIHATNQTLFESEVHLYLDMTNQQIAVTIFAEMAGTFQKFAKIALAESGYNPFLAEPPIAMKEPIYGEKDPNFTEFMAPGMIMGITYIMAVGLTSMSIIIERKDGLLDRSIVAGVGALEIIFSILFHLFVMMVLQVALILLVTFFVFDIPVKGSIAWMVICVLLVGLSGMSYGLFVSAICPDENAAMMVAMGSFYPNLLLSGIIWPVEAMPDVLRGLSYGLPMTLIAKTLRGILSKGWDIGDYDMWQGPIVSLAWTIGLVFLAWIIFKYRKYS